MNREKYRNSKNQLISKIAAKRNCNELSVRKKSSMMARENVIHSSDVALIMQAKEEGIPYSGFLKQLSNEDQRCASEYHGKQQSKKIILRDSKKANNNKTYKKPIEKIIEYDTDNPFIKGHVEEVNRAYTHGCYTSVFILSRKIIENLIMDILREKYKENINPCYDTDQKRLKDFSIILKILEDKKNDFCEKGKAVSKLHQLAGKLKDRTNDATHSWYYLVKKKNEIEELDLPQIMDLIRELEKYVGIRE